MTTGVATSPAEYITNTDETDVLQLDASAELAVSETVIAAACEMRQVPSRTDVSSSAFPVGGNAIVAGTAVNQRFDARVLLPGHYEWTWTLTLSSGAVRSYRTLLKVENHD